MTARQSRCFLSLAIVLLASSALNAQQCQARVVQPVTDDLGNMWNAGRILPVDIERDDSTGGSFCAHGGGCVPRILHGVLAVALINCHIAEQLGGGDRALLPPGEAESATLNANPEMIRPSQADASIQQFDDPNVVLMPPASASLPQPPLALFLPGTNGKPENAMRLMQVVAEQGYRVVGLTYDDLPAGTELCPHSPNPACFTGFHSMRVFGQGPSPVQNTYGESIEGRLANLLRYLDREHPGEGWSAYLASDGHPQWSRILVSGLSQGAGMAAYIAKVRRVYRVVLFSSPWDNTSQEHRPARWLSEPAATPMDLWWAERHVKENTTDWLANAYRALRIPATHILLFNLELPEGKKIVGDNPYHASTVRNDAYAPLWRQMYGSVHGASAP